MDFITINEENEQLYKELETLNKILELLDWENSKFHNFNSYNYFNYSILDKENDKHLLNKILKMEIEHIKKKIIELKHWNSYIIKFIKEL